MENTFTFTFKIKKTTLLTILIIVLVLAFVLLCSILYFKSNENGTLIIRGEVVSDIPIQLDPPRENMLIPLVAVLQKLGYSTTQQDENTIMITDNDQQFELNLAELTLYEIGGKNFNYLQSPPGHYWDWCTRNGNDVILDAVTFNSTLRFMNSGYKVADIPKYEVVFVY